jgi:hypothetical protein
MISVVDNDILIKGACYGLLNGLVAPAEVVEARIGILGAARFVVPKQIRRKAPQRGVAAAVSTFEEFLQRSQLLEPTTAEQAMAADLELAAQISGLNLDAGESQLCAIVTLRSVPLLLTGDKRAIRAIESLLGSDNRLGALRQRVKCLEQLVLDLLTALGSTATLRPTICAESHIDKALTICFGCHSPDITPQEAELGLQSYIDDLRRDAPQILAP